MVGVQEKSTTAFAANSYTPASVSEWNWDDFLKLIEKEAAKPENQKHVDTKKLKTSNSLQKRWSRPGVLNRVSREQQVTSNVESVLSAAEQSYLMGVEFISDDIGLKASADLRVCNPKPASRSSGLASLYISPQKRTAARKTTLQSERDRVLYTIETKPFWKYRFFMAPSNENIMVQLWEKPRYPIKNATDVFPSNWDSKKKKVYHLVRQVCGQMKTDGLFFATIHIYEWWWFCHLDENDNMFITPPLAKEATSPSVLQALKSLAGLARQPRSEDGAVQLENEKVPTRPARGSEKRKEKTTGRGSATRPGRQRVLGETGCASDPGSVAKLSASEIQLWDCDLVGLTDHSKLLTTKCGFGLVKILRDRREAHLVEEMKNEAEVYRVIAEKGVDSVVPSFFGYSEHLGTPMLCLENEGSDFEDIGVENLTCSLKLSAVHALQCLSNQGILHGDVALRNIVQSRSDSDRAKIIDFGRSSQLCEPSDSRLVDQVVDLRRLLALE